MARHFLVFLILTCSINAPAVVTTAFADEQVTRPFHGIILRRLTLNDPRPLVIWIAEIDLTAIGISFRLTPGNGDPNGSDPGDPNGETTRQTTLDFLKEQKAQLAINASFYGLKETKATDNVGLVVSDGEKVSPFFGDWPSINIDAKNRVSFLKGLNDTYKYTEENNCRNLYNAFSGSDQIITDGKATTDDREFSTSLNPRTAIGYRTDNKLILVTIDGRQPRISEGMSLLELAKFMISLDCVQALNLDGGGSTTLAIADPEPRVLNIPSSKDEEGQYGVLRKNGTNLAVFASPILSD